MKGNGLAPELVETSFADDNTCGNDGRGEGAELCNASHGDLGWLRRSLVNDWRASADGLTGEGRAGGHERGC